MVILHIAHIENEKLAGVSVAVPQHVLSQASFAKIGFINTNNNNKIKALEQYQIFCDGKFDLKSLPEPFNKPDIVVLHEVYYPEFLGVSKSLKKNAIPYVLVPHGCLSSVAQNNKKLKKLIGNFLAFNKIMKNAVAIQCLSENEKENILFDYPKFIGTNGVYMPEKQKCDFCNNGINFTFIGRVDFYIKGIDLLLEAIKISADELRNKNSKFKIYGPCDVETNLKISKIINEFKISDIISLLPSVFGEEKEEVLLKTDIFVLTSRTEGMSMSILEALSYGLPCLVTRGTNLFDFVKNNSLGWTSETTASEISKAISLALSEEKKYSVYSQNALNTIRENYSWDIVAENTVEAYKNILN